LQRAGHRLAHRAQPDKTDALGHPAALWARPQDNLWGTAKAAAL
jgi:hypothetical protein